jgi:hypothetical protein
MRTVKLPSRSDSIGAYVANIRFRVFCGSTVALACVALCASAQAPPQTPSPNQQTPAANQGFGQAPRFAASRTRPRVIVTTDGEIDDMCSMVRFLMYANEFQVEGLIHSSSRFHWLGQTWSGVEWINNQIDQYARVYDLWFSETRSTSARLQHNRLFDPAHLARAVAEWSGD